MSNGVSYAPLIPIGFVAASILNYVWLLPFQRASANGAYPPSMAIGDIAAAHVIHVVVVSVIVGLAYGSLKMAAASQAAQDIRTVFRWACVAHLPFLVWALVTMVLIWPVTADVVTPTTLEMARERVRLTSFARPLVWTTSTVLFVAQARLAVRKPVWIVSALTVLPVLLTWGLLELVVRILD